MANNLKTEKKIAVVSMLAEGNSIRAIERITGVNQNTIMRQQWKREFRIMSGLWKNS